MDCIMMKSRNDAFYSIWDSCMQNLKTMNNKIYQLIQKDDEFSTMIMNEMTKLIMYECEFIHDGWDEESTGNMFIDSEEHIYNFIKSQIEKYVKEFNEEEIRKSIDLENKKKQREERRKVSSKQQINKFSTFYTEDEQIGLFDEDY